jgi:hypothetical protein
MCRFISGGVACACDKGIVGLRKIFFLSALPKIKNKKKQISSCLYFYQFWFLIS